MTNIDDKLEQERLDDQFVENLLNSNGSSLTSRRKILISMFYRYELGKHTYEYIQQDILDENQFKIDESTSKVANDINDKWNEIVDEIESKLADKWHFDRIPALIRSILIVGVYEIKFTDTPKAVTINEMVSLTKTFEPDYNFKFVNGLLDKVNKI
ncbi:transcription antitermination factor NusB [Mesoplasma photuris]|uniref:transcription antitermination factor NusB n=1 Tax=Mesoplasma photuris TaxID=217731 RepID=UPI000A06BCCC|nr:transcription antitermination factor NusB [Mesoplasma photuris]